MCVDVRLDSGRSGRLGAEVGLRSLSAIVGPRIGGRAGTGSVQAASSGPFRDSRVRARFPGAYKSGGGGWSRASRGRQSTAVSALGEAQAAAVPLGLR